jgi:DNA-binding response OmpR family regulator
VLVVDDEETVRAVTARILESAGFRVTLAGDGREGVERFRSDPSIRLVLLDLTMPRLSGEDAYRELRTIRESTPVILMSGYSPEELKIQFAGKGLAGYLRKPFRPSELLSTVKQAFERRRSP